MTTAERADERPSHSPYALAQPWGLVVRVLRAHPDDDWALVEAVTGGRYHILLDDLRPLSGRDLH